MEAAYAAPKLAFELGEQVRGMREERGWSQRELAKLTGMTQPARLVTSEARPAWHGRRLRIRLVR